MIQNEYLVLGDKLNSIYYVNLNGHILAYKDYKDLKNGEDKSYVNIIQRYIEEFDFNSYRIGIGIKECNAKEREEIIKQLSPFINSYNTRLYFENECSNNDRFFRDCVLLSTINLELFIDIMDMFNNEGLITSDFMLIPSTHNQKELLYLKTRLDNMDISFEIIRPFREYIIEYCIRYKEKFINNLIEHVTNLVIEEGININIMSENEFSNQIHKIINDNKRLHILNDIKGFKRKICRLVYNNLLERKR